MQILTNHKDTLVTLSELLIEREVLDFEDVDSIMKTGKLPERKVAEEPASETEPPADITASDKNDEISDETGPA